VINLGPQVVANKENTTIQDLIPSEKITYRICPIYQISKSTTYLCLNASRPVVTEAPTKCIWLPRYEETQILLDKYINEVAPLHHVVHVPSLRQLVDDIYIQLRQHTTPDKGKIILLLSIIASATFYWHCHDNRRKLFSTPAEANAQTTSWVRTTIDLLDHYRWSEPGSVECTQAIIIISIVICNGEGVSCRLRNLLNMAITMARELSLHQLDRESTTVMTDVPRLKEVQLEIGRRVWWYLVGTDWYV
jgi:hypothetical protein